MVQRIQAFSVSSDEPGPEDLPVALKVENVLGCKWSIHLLRLLTDGYARPSEILRASPGLSAKVMNERWRMMIRFGIVRRTVLGDRPPIRVEYALTGVGRRFIVILDEVRRLQEDIDEGKVSTWAERTFDGR